MPFRIFTIAFDREKECFFDEELNKFCINKRVKKTDIHFFTESNKAYWTAFIEYDEVIDGEKPTNTSNLNEPEKLLYQRLKEWRKDRAEKDGVPVYIVSTNGELLDLITKAPKTLESLRALKGFGKKKIEKYGKEIIEIITSFYNTK